ncbi:hypothetical protein E1178_20045 [Roseibium hamelinense]|nr:hypothetical protein [Roseibium hamelinense]
MSEHNLQVVPEDTLTSYSTAPLAAAIRRALDVVTSETVALRENPSTNLQSFEYRKSQALLDLTRARQAIPADALDSDIEDLLYQLRLALDDNMSLLSRHLNAVGEIAEMLAEAILEADSDGTYQQPIPEPVDD